MYLHHRVLPDEPELIGQKEKVAFRCQCRERLEPDS
jgi:hypothetical protein